MATYKPFVRTHGLSGHPLYSVWKSMRHRCYFKNHPQYNDWGARGIDICVEWRENFVEFFNWAMTNGWERGLQIDRRDNDRGYSQSNCRFVTSEVQQNNKRPLNLSEKARAKRVEGGKRRQASMSSEERSALGKKARAAVSPEIARVTAVNARSYLTLDIMQESGRKSISKFNATRTPEINKAIGRRVSEGKRLAAQRRREQ